MARVWLATVVNWLTSSTGQLQLIGIIQKLFSNGSSLPDFFPPMYILKKRVKKWFSERLTSQLYSVGRAKRAINSLLVYLFITHICVTRLVISIPTMYVSYFKALLSCVSYSSIHETPVEGKNI